MEGGNVRVALRIRPLCARERLAGSTEVISVSSDGRTVLAAPDRHFTFDTVFATTAGQTQVFEEIAQPLLDYFLEGYNCTVVAYGQTGSGKTFTMGTGLEGLDELTVGIIPRAVDYLFKQLETLFVGRTEDDGQFFEIYVSFLELYNEEIIDLLNAQCQDKCKRPVLTIREDPSGNICIAGVKEERATNMETILECLNTGTLSRTTKSTDMNLVSSRSHAIFTLTLRQRRTMCDAEGAATQRTLVSKMHFVDLAGSERLKRTGAVGERARESISINSGLLALGNVISALGDEGKKATHVPYRDSKLTRLLQDSLGGNSRTVMVACISPSSDNYSETVNTLKYANRARNIKNNAVMNEDAAGNAAFEIMQLKKQVAALKTEILQLRSLGIRRTMDTTLTPRRASATIGPDAEELVRLRSHNKELQRRLEALQREKINMEAERDFYKSNAVAPPSGGAEKNLQIIKDHLRTISDLRLKLTEMEQRVSHTNVSNNSSNPAGVLGRPLRRRTTIGASSKTSVNVAASPSATQINMETPNWFNTANQLIDRTRQELRENQTMMTELRHNAMDELLQEEAPTNTGAREAFAAAVMARTEAMLSQLQTDQSVKEELMVLLENSQQEYLVMRRRYEERQRLLHENLMAVQRERDLAIRAPAPRDDARTMRIKYEEKIKKMGRENNALKEQLAAATRDAGSRYNSNDLVIRNLRSALATAKSERSRLQTRLEELGQRLQNECGGQEAEIKDLRQRERRASEQARKFKKAYEFQKSLLQKRIEQYLQTKNRVRYLLNMMRKHRIPLSPSVGNLLESPSWRRSDTLVTRSISPGPFGTPLPGATSRGSSGLGSKSISAADLNDAHEATEKIETLSLLDGEGDISFVDVHPSLGTPTKASSSSLASTPRRSSLVKNVVPFVAPLGSEVSRSVLRLSPLLTRPQNIFSRLADATSLKLAASQVTSGSSPASRAMSRNPSDDLSCLEASPMKIDAE